MGEPSALPACVIRYSSLEPEESEPSGLTRCAPPAATTVPLSASDGHGQLFLARVTPWADEPSALAAHASPCLTKARESASAEAGAAAATAASASSRAGRGMTGRP